MEYEVMICSTDGSSVCKFKTMSQFIDMMEEYVDIYNYDYYELEDIYRSWMDFDDTDV